MINLLEMIELLLVLVWFHVEMQMQWLLGILEDIQHLLKKYVKVIDPRPGEIMFGLNMIVNRGKPSLFVIQQSIEYGDEKQLAEMAISAARVVRLFGFDPKLLFYLIPLLANQQQTEQKE